MKEMSNSTLAMLVVVAIVVSVFGTLMSLTRLDELGGGFGLAGMVSTSTNTSAAGIANLSVAGTAWVNATDNIIQLGTLEPTETNDSDTVNDWWILKNDGTVNITIRVYSHPTMGNPANQTGGTGTAVAGKGPFSGSQGCMNDINPTCFMVKCMNSTDRHVICNSTWKRLPTAVNGDTSLPLIINLSYTNQSGPVNDTTWFGVQATVPAVEGAGQKLQDVLFYAENSNP